LRAPRLLVLVLVLFLEVLLVFRLLRMVLGRFLDLRWLRSFTGRRLLRLLQRTSVRRSQLRWLLLALLLFFLLFPKPRNSFLIWRLNEILLLRSWLR